MRGPAPFPVEKVKVVVTFKTLPATRAAIIAEAAKLGCTPSALVSKIVEQAMKKRVC